MMTRSLSFRLLIASMAVLCVFGCTPSESVQSEPGQVTPGTSSDPSPSYTGVQLPAAIRKDAWYSRTESNGYASFYYRYRFTSEGAEFQQQFSGGDYLFRKADGSYFSIFEPGQYSQLDAEQVENLRELGVDAGADPESVKADLERVAIAKRGDWITIISRAAIESTENTVSISWAEIDKNLATFFQCDDESERLRIEDDGLKLVRIANDETFYVLD